MVHSSFDVAPAATEPSTVIQWPPPWSPNMRDQPTADGRPTVTKVQWQQQHGCMWTVIRPHMEAP